MKKRGATWPRSKFFQYDKNSGVGRTAVVLYVALVVIVWGMGIYFTLTDGGSTAFVTGKRIAPTTTVYTGGDFLVVAGILTLMGIVSLLLTRKKGGLF
jgi:hypothetical protein